MKTDIETMAAMLDGVKIEYQRYNSPPASSPFDDRRPAGGGVTILLTGPIFIEFDADGGLYNIWTPEVQ